MFANLFILYPCPSELNPPYTKFQKVQLIKEIDISSVTKSTTENDQHSLLGLQGPTDAAKG